MNIGQQLLNKEVVFPLREKYLPLVLLFTLKESSPLPSVTDWTLDENSSLDIRLLNQAITFEYLPFNSSSKLSK